MCNQLGPGTTFYGYCEGVWDDAGYHGDKIVIASGAGWLVVKDTYSGRFMLAQDDDLEILRRHTSPSEV
jgi:hypothetical protein